MNNVVDISEAKNNPRLETKQTAKFIILTLNEMIKSEGQVIADMEDILRYLEACNTFNEDLTASDKAIITDLDVKALETTQDAMNLVKDLAEVFIKYDLMQPQGVFTAKEIREQYKELDNE